MHPYPPLEEPSSLTGQNLFYRRVDLGAELRIKIATIALFFQIHGTITQLSRRHSVSRQFVYNLRTELRQRLAGLFEQQEAQQEASRAKRQLLRAILHLRLVGRCSLHAISGLISALGLGQASTAYISQELEAIGSGLGNTLAYEGQVVFLCDEIFCPNPILVTVEPQSMAILRIDKVAQLDKQAWQAHWQGLEQAGIESQGFVKDEGAAMAKAQRESYGQTPVQSDTFHAIAYKLGSWASRLEKQAYGAIAKEYKRQGVWQRAQKRNHAAIQEQKQESYLEACWACQLAVEQYELFVFLYGHILEQLQAFDKNGQPGSSTQAKQEVEVALQYMAQLNIKGLAQALNSIQNRLAEGLFAFLDKAQLVFQYLKARIPAHSLPFWCLAWQANKNYIKAKSKRRRQVAQKQYLCLIELLRQDCQQNNINFEPLRQLAFGQLDAIVQSSALVEAVNSIIRPYVSLTRQQISQPFLQLIMFFHNHRKFVRGKRKGKAPIEMLTGQKLESGPIDLMLQAAGL